MKNLFLIVLLAVLADGMIARQTRTEVTNTPTISDARPNSDSVPDAYAIGGQFGRIVVFRLKYQTDLLTGLEAVVRQERIRNGVILSGIGSVRNYRYHTVSNRTFPSRDAFIADSTGSADITGMNGYIVNGRVHAHVSLANADKAFGGHLETGTNVFTFAIVTVGILMDDTDLSRVDDKTYR